MKPLPTKERINELFHYDAQSGALFWKERSASEFPDLRAFRIWNTRYSGHVAGGCDKKGYIQIRIDSRRHSAHRLVWTMHNGDPCGLSIDHINHNKSDNRIENLRLTTHAENQRNLSISRNNTSGHVGVYFNKSKSIWRAYICVNGKVKHLGSFPNIYEAISARNTANIENMYHKNHGMQL